MGRLLPIVGESKCRNQCCKYRGDIRMFHHLSLLQNLKRSDIYDDPFPHIIIDSALPIGLCNELQRTFPPLASLGVDETADNQRWSTSARHCQSIPGLSRAWLDMIDYHTSRTFLNEVVSTFKVQLVSLYPEYFSNSDEIMNGRECIRRGDGNIPKNCLALDAQISGNTPAKNPGQPNKIHFDATNALYAGLYYLRDASDDSEGGDLQIWRWRSTYSFREKSSAYSPNIPLRHVELVKTIPYKANTFVLLINSIDSLHSVTTRQPTIHTRKFLNLLADAPAPFFQLQPSMLSRAARRLVRGLQRFS